MSVFHRFSITLFAFGCCIAVWWIVTSVGLVNAFLLPSPLTVWRALAELWSSGELLRHTLASAGRVGIGYALAVSIAIPLAILFSISGPFRTFVEPLLEFLRQIPPLALMPLLMLWLGIGEAQKIGIIILACFFPVFLGMRGGIAQVDRKLMEVGKVCGLGQWEIVYRIVMPSALPALVIGLRISLGYSWRALVGAELIASSAGLGYLITDAQDLARTDIVLAGILVIGVIGLATDFVLKRVCSRLAPWLASDLEMARA
ncbi:ABC transporter permease (plasmid) [Rhizobium sp. ACO-34A]|nr:ABC transporter permease [Rhizobium sp. ACO-34A]ATN36726.1 ABC transporter permease [Rhizobium sp. ACO-34A]